MKNSATRIKVDPEVLRRLKAKRQQLESINNSPILNNGNSEISSPCIPPIYFLRSHAKKEEDEEELKVESKRHQTNNTSPDEKMEKIRRKNLQQISQGNSPMKSPVNKARLVEPDDDWDQIFYETRNDGNENEVEENISNLSDW